MPQVLHLADIGRPRCRVKIQVKWMLHRQRLLQYGQVHSMQMVRDGTSGQKRTHFLRFQATGFPVPSAYRLYMIKQPSYREDTILSNAPNPWVRDQKEQRVYPQNCHPSPNRVPPSFPTAVCPQSMENSDANRYRQHRQSQLAHLSNLQSSATSLCRTPLRHSRDPG